MSDRLITIELQPGLPQMSAFEAFARIMMIFNTAGHVQRPDLIKPRDLLSAYDTITVRISPAPPVAPSASDAPTAQPTHD